LNFAGFRLPSNKQAFDFAGGSMTKKQENKRSMYGAVMATLDANNSIIAGVPALANAKADFDRLVKQIDERSIQKREALAGKKVIKDKAEEELIAATIKVSAAAVAFASRNRKIDLKAKADVTPSRLRQMRVTELVNKAIAIHDAAGEVITELTDYGINEQSLVDLNRMITVFDGAIKSREVSLADRSSAGIDLAKLFEDVDLLLKEQIDKLIELVKPDNKQFYDAFQAARVIKDLGIRRKEKPSPLSADDA